MLKLLVFDLDGTLADTREDLWRSVNHALSASGLPSLPLESVLSRIGNGARALIDGCIADAKRLAGTPREGGSMSVSAPAAGEGDVHVDRALAAFIDHYRDHCLDRTAPYPGVAASLERLGGYRKAVLTNKPTRPAVRILEGLGLAGHFEYILGGDNPHGKKPDPAALGWLMAAVDAAPRATAMIGDGVQDARAARRAGARMIGFLGGIAPREDLLAESPDAWVEAMRDLPEAIAGLEARLGAEAAR